MFSLLKDLALLLWLFGCYIVFVRHHRILAIAKVVATNA